jgi:hypothetical protein
MDADSGTVTSGHSNITLDRISTERDERSRGKEEAIKFMAHT